MGIIRNINRFTATLALILCCSSQAFSTHAQNLELFYRHVNDSSYEFTLIFFRNCCSFCTGAPTQFNLNYQSNSLNQSGTFTLARLPTTGIGVPPLNPENMFNCVDSSGECIEEYTYRGTWTSKGRASDWKFFVQLCCRSVPNGPVNLLNSSQYIEVGLNNLDFPDGQAKNWSPIFYNRRPNHPGYTSDTVLNYYYKNICAGQYTTFFEEAREYQGDSVSYSLVHPQTNGGNPAQYINGFCFSGCAQGQLPTLNGPLTINPVTGAIQIQVGQPTLSGRYFVTVQATEYRNDTIVSGGAFTIVPKVIGYIKRDLKIRILDSSTCRIDSLRPLDMHFSEQPGNNTIRIKFRNHSVGSQDSRIRCNTISSDGSEFRIVDSSTYIAPFDSTVSSISVLGASWNCQGGFAEYIDLQLGTQLKCNTYHLLLKKGSDLDVLQSECGYWEPEFSSSLITTDTMREVYLGPDTTVCSNKAFSMTLDADTGFSSYYWSSWDTTQSITVTYLTKYWVKVTNAMNCEAYDTIQIFKEYCPPDSTRDTSTVGIETRSNENVNIFPNPVSDVLNVHLSEFSRPMIRLYDLNSRPLIEFQAKDEQFEIDMSNLARGMYYIEISDGQYRIIKRILRQ